MSRRCPHTNPSTSRRHLSCGHTPYQYQYQHAQTGTQYRQPQASIRPASNASQFRKPQTGTPTRYNTAYQARQPQTVSPAAALRENFQQRTNYQQASRPSSFPSVARNQYNTKPNPASTRSTGSGPPRPDLASKMAWKILETIVAKTKAQQSQAAQRPKAPYSGNNPAYRGSNPAYRGNIPAYNGNNPAFRGSNPSSWVGNPAFRGNNPAYRGNTAARGSNPAYRPFPSLYVTTPTPTTTPPVGEVEPVEVEGPTTTPTPTTTPMLAWPRPMSRQSTATSSRSWNTGWLSQGTSQGRHPPPPPSLPPFAKHTPPSCTGSSRMRMCSGVICILLERRSRCVGM